MTRRRLSVALVVLVLLGTPWADAAAQYILGDYIVRPSAKLQKVESRRERRPSLQTRGDEGQTAHAMQP